MFPSYQLKDDEKENLLREEEAEFFCFSMCFKYLTILWKKTIFINYDIL